MKFTTALELLLKTGARKATCAAGDLNGGSEGHGFGTQKEGNAKHSFVAQETHFYAFTAVSERPQREQDRVREVRMTQHFSRFTKDLAALKENRFQIGNQLLPFLAAKSRQYAILQRRKSYRASH